MERLNMTDEQWSGYLADKLRESIRSSAYVMDSLEFHKNEIPEEILDDLKSHQHYIIDKMLLVFAGLEGKIKQYTHHDAELIFELGQAGWEEVLFNYGLGPEPEHVRRKRLYPQFIAELLSVLVNPAREGRRDFYDIVEKYHFKDTESKHLMLMIEPVTQGDKSWEDFRKEATTFIQQIAVTK